MGLGTCFHHFCLVCANKAYACQLLLVHLCKFRIKTSAPDSADTTAIFARVRDETEFKLKLMLFVRAGSIFTWGLRDHTSTHRKVTIGCYASNFVRRRLLLSPSGDGVNYVSHTLTSTKSKVRRG
jgi:hypothetical protein